MSIGVAKCRRVAGALCGSLGLLASAHANAGTLRHVTNHSFTENFGNSNFGAYYTFRSTEAGISDVQSTAADWANATQFVEVGVNALGKTSKPISATANGVGERRQGGSTLPSTYCAFAQGRLTLMDTDLINEQPGWVCSTPGGSSSAKSAVNRTVPLFSRTLSTPSMTFMVSFVPVTVSGSVVGNLETGVVANGSSATWLGKANTFFGSGSAKLSARTWVDVHMNAFAGIPGILGVGVNPHLRLIDVNMAPNSMNKFNRTTANAFGGTVTWKNQLTFTITTLNGSVDVYAQITPLLRPTTNLLAWNGYTWTGEWFNDSGSVGY